MAKQLDLNLRFSRKQIMVAIEREIASTYTSAGLEGIETYITTIDEILDEDREYFSRRISERRRRLR